MEAEESGRRLWWRWVFWVSEGLVESSGGDSSRTRCIEVDGQSPLMFEHMSLQEFLGIRFRRPDRAKSLSPSHLLGVGVAADLLEARDPDSTAGMVSGTVLLDDRLGDGGPEGLKGLETLDCHDGNTSPRDVEFNQRDVGW